MYDSGDTYAPSSAAIDNLLSYSPTTLLFSLTLGRQTSTTLRLTNLSLEPLVYKIKTNQIKRYCVRPNANLIPTAEIRDVKVVQQAFSSSPPDLNSCTDRFQLLVAPLSAIPYGPSLESRAVHGYLSMSDLWAAVPLTAVRKEKFHVNMRLRSPSAVSPSPKSPSTKSPSPKSPSSKSPSPEPPSPKPSVPTLVPNSNLRLSPSPQPQSPRNPASSSPPPPRTDRDDYADGSVIVRVESTPDTSTPPLISPTSPVNPVLPPITSTLSIPLDDPSVPDSPPTPYESKPMSSPSSPDPRAKPPLLPPRAPALPTAPIIIKNYLASSTATPSSPPVSLPRVNSASTTSPSPPLPTRPVPPPPITKSQSSEHTVSPPVSPTFVTNNLPDTSPPPQPTPPKKIAAPIPTGLRAIALKAVATTSAAASVASTTAAATTAKTTDAVATAAKPISTAATSAAKPISATVAAATKPVASAADKLLSTPTRTPPPLPLPVQRSLAAALEPAVTTIRKSPDDVVPAVVDGTTVHTNTSPPVPAPRLEIAEPEAVGPDIPLMSTSSRTTAQDIVAETRDDTSILKTQTPRTTVSTTTTSPESSTSPSLVVDYVSPAYMRERVLNIKTPPTVVVPELDRTARQRVAVERAGELVRVINGRLSDIEEVAKQLEEARHRLSDARLATRPAYDVRFEVQDSAPMPMMRICIMAFLSGALLQLLV